MQQWEKIGLVLAALALFVVYCFRANQAPKPIYTVTEDELANTTLGDSAPNSTSRAPAYMNANYAPPFPLALWTPSTNYLQN